MSGEIHFHPARSGGIGEGSAIHLGVSGGAIVSSCQAGSGGILHIDGYSFNSIHICTAGFVISNRFNCTGYSNFRSKINGFVAGIGVIAVNWIRLSRAASTYSNLGGAPTSALSVLEAVYAPAVALNIMEASVPTAIDEEAETLKLSVVFPAAAIALKVAVPVFTVMPKLGLVSVAEPAKEAAAPVLFRGMLIVTVSPGSSLPLLLPGAGSLMFIFPKAKAGALNTLLKLYVQVFDPLTMVMEKAAESWFTMLLATVKLKALFIEVLAPAAREAIVSVASVSVIPAVAQVKVALTSLAVEVPLFLKVTLKRPLSLYSATLLLLSA